MITLPLDKARIAVTILIASLSVSCGGAPANSPSGAAGSAAPVSPMTSTVPAQSPAAAASGSLDPVAARQADLDLLVERLKAIHPNPFLDEGEAAFTERVDRIREDVGSMTDAGFLVAIMDLMGHRDRDGHSGAWAMAQTGSRLHAWPIWLWDFPDGLRIVAARAPYDDLVGARVTMVGGASVEDAIATVESLVPRDNPSTLRGNLPTYLTLPEVVEELGLVQPGDTVLTLQLVDGTTRELTPEPIPIEAFRDWIFGVYGGRYPAGLPPDDDGPLYLQHHDLAFWTEEVKAPAMFYVGYNEVRRTSGSQTIDELASEITAAAAAEPERPIVIDLRNNGGGDNNTYGPLRRAAETVAHGNPGGVTLITGRGTFSAAGNFVTDLLVGPEKAGIRLAGEAPGGGLNIYGDVDVVTLPASQIVVLVSARYHEKAPGDTRLALPPDVPAEVTWADYVAGRDSVLEAALEP
jgi:hypothetical protein